MKVGIKDFLAHFGLSNREVEVAELVSKGLSNTEIANKLFVVEKTVKFHMTHIMKKLKLKSRSELIVFILPEYQPKEINPDEPVVKVSPEDLDKSRRHLNLPGGNA